ncbi:MAG: glycosyltransferase family 9 protein [Gammaproteobacteria bacterium]|nr:glycosyltransferase family 9 protein [Gammaproteobacteria bacterium]
MSAIGDISHTLPILRTIQAAWPTTQISWIIGKTEYELVKDIEGVEFIIFDKKRGLKGYFDIRKQLKGRQFDLLLHMQMSIRSSLISLFINSPIKLGFDRARAKDYQWLFTNHKIAAREREHVIDSFFGFTDAIGISERVVEWNIPIPEEAQQYAEQQLPDGAKYLIISPCSSMAYRNWLPDRYATVADYAVKNLGYQVVLTGGNSPIEQKYAIEIIELMEEVPINLIGKSSLKQLLAVLKRAEIVIAPDSGPAHLATAVGTPVIGLYACTNPDRARPYMSHETTVNRYPEAIKQKYETGVSSVKWGERVRDEFAMPLIKIKDVTSILQTMGKTQ